MFLLMILQGLVLSSRSVQVRNICGEANGRQMYVELGAQGTIIASTSQRETTLKAHNSTTQPRQCALELVACPSCVISLRFTFLNISGDFLSDDCLCDHVLIFEVPYAELSRQKFCGDSIESTNASLFYISQTRDVTVKFVYTSDYELAFSLDYFSRKNQYLIEGSPDFPETQKKNRGDQHIATPFFPKYYPRDVSIEYVLTCKGAQPCRIVIIFTDFQISKYSIIEFSDWKGERIFIASGSAFRPPILISPGPTLRIKFYANGGINLGFKAAYSFLSEKELASVKNINTACGGYVNNLGGRISMMNMIENGTVQYDCVWIIRPIRSYLFAKTHLYLRLTKLKNFDSAKLVIRQGSTSTGEAVDTLTYFPQTILAGKEHLIAVNEGFYVSLKASFQAGSMLEIVYAAISYANCSSVSDFTCHNRRCISTLLYCDGFNHCGDNSDEPDTCSREGRAPQRQHTANFYFANSERYFDLKTVTIVFIISSLALLSLMLSLIILLYRINVRGNNNNNNPRHLQSHFQAINDFLESSLGVEVEEEIIVDDVPPKYEAPPDYKEVIKRRSARKSLKRNAKRKSAAKSGIDSRGAKTPNHNENEPCQNSASTSSTVCKDSEKAVEKYESENISPSPSQCRSKIQLKLTASLTFEGAKNLMDSLNIDLPKCSRNIKEKLFARRVLYELKDWPNSNFKSVSRRIFSASNLTLYSSSDD